MISFQIIAFVTLTTALVAGWLHWLRHRRLRDRHYARLESETSQVITGQEIKRALRAPPSETLKIRFSAERIVRIDQFLDGELLAAMRQEALQSRPVMERSYIPAHKQGSTLAYENVMRLAPICFAMYRSRALSEWLSELVQLPLVPTPLRDQSSLSILSYEREGDHIGWHFDHNFYVGRHFTVLLSLVNQGGHNGISSSHFERQGAAGGTEIVDTSENVLVVFEGTRVRHRATRATQGDLRLILSMTYCTDPRIRWTREMLRRLKDTAFFGLRALWD